MDVIYNNDGTNNLRSLKSASEFRYAIPDGAISFDQFCLENKITDESGRILDEKNYKLITEYREMWVNAVNATLDIMLEKSSLAGRIGKMTEKDFCIYQKENNGGKATMIATIDVGGIKFQGSILPKYLNPEDYVQTNDLVGILLDTLYSVNTERSEWNMKKISNLEYSIFLAVHETLHLIHYVNEGIKVHGRNKPNFNYIKIGKNPLNFDEVKTLQASFDLLPRVIRKLGREPRVELSEWLRINKTRLNKAIPGLLGEQASS